MSGAWIIGITFAIYILGMLVVGLMGYWKTKDLADYLIGGRKMNFFVTALSAGASDMSGWLIMGLPGAIFVAGVTEAWIGVALLLGTFLNWMFIAKPLRKESERLGSLTISDYFEQKFTDKTRVLRVLTAIVTLTFFIFYTVSGLVAGGKLFHSVFGMDYRLAVTLSALAIILYTSVGGFIAVSITDAVQGILMLAALITVPIFAIFNVGGIPPFFQTLQESGSLSWFATSTGQTVTAIGMISTFGWGLGYFGMPHILTRFMAIDSVKNINKARITATAWTAFSLFAAIFVGLAGIALFGKGIGDGEIIFIKLIQAFFHPIPAGICLAAILAAIMSTADSQLLVCTSVITEDIYRTFFRKEASEKELINVGRFAVVIIALLAMFLAFNQDSKVMDIVSYAWAGFGAAFGPAIILSLYWKKMSGAGAVAGMVSGGATVLIWNKLSGGIFEVYEIIPGFILSLIGIVLFSLIFPKKEKVSA